MMETRGMRDMPKLNFPTGSLLAAMLGGQAPADIRRAAQRLRAEGAPALAVDDEIAALAHGLAGAEVARLPAVLDGLPPLFWLEARQEDGTRGWVMERKPGGLALRGFGLAGPGAAPELEGTATLPFGTGIGEEDAEGRWVRGLVTAVALPGLMAQMGESSPVVLVPAEAAAVEAAALRGMRLSVAVSPDSLPD